MWCKEAVVVCLQNWVPAFAGTTVLRLRAKECAVSTLLINVVPAQAGTQVGWSAVKNKKPCMNCRVFYCGCQRC